MVDSEDFLPIIQKLIDTLSQAIVDAEKKDDNYRNEPNEWRDPAVWEGVIEELEKIKSAGNSPQVLAGLAKHFDYYSLECFTEQDQKNIWDVVKKIVSLSSGNLSSYFKKNCSGNDEGGACSIACSTSRMRFKHYRNIPPEYAVNFVPTPSVEFLSSSSDSKLVRVIGKKNNPYGHWWMLCNLPKSQKDWRSDMAVLKAWNAGDHYVEYILSQDEIFKLWRGAAASQAIPNKPCILKGGGEQVWLSLKDVEKIKTKGKIKVEKWNP